MIPTRHRYRENVVTMCGDGGVGNVIFQGAIDAIEELRFGQARV